MAEIGSGGRIPDGQYGNLVPGGVGEERDAQGLVAECAVEGEIGDRGTEGEVPEVGAIGAPPPDSGGSSEHIETGDGEGTAVEDADDTAELVLDHGELGLHAGEGSVLIAGNGRGGSRGVDEGEEEEEEEELKW